ncbi:hypothetical protein [Aliirhizobium cellulosilyticum]|uniref:Uncharacterized protein n=1 Tax=Aliirhizobium cellulosilyticum TaxID=393664 RepID=A0A7W6S655_9HYPH|nr:hypothetical protein [Rhizobium cellulosilyticum]MBB4347949.1 hypothetical protein [Rhizobium cellulosilyticum]MBB4409657.1 hypothetical protein [Rhizobium cellulosilyticum]MBB4444344.1 hypothetical protein [Rhizobium cellulosilyticum]
MIIRDGDWSLFDYDHQTGRSVWCKDDGVERVFRIDTPVDHIIRENEFTRNATSGNRMGDWVKIASIPLNHAHHENLVRAHTEGDDKFVKRWLNDGDNRAFRSFEATI